MHLETGMQRFFTGRDVSVTGMVRCEGRGGGLKGGGLSCDVFVVRCFRRAMLSSCDTFVA